MAKQSSSLSRKIFIYKIVILFLAIAILFVSYQYWQLNERSRSGKDSLLDRKIDTTAVPYYKEVMDIIRPLDYSVIPSLLQQPDIKLSIDFLNRTWTLKNFHQYDSEGNVIIEDHRYGLCGELASYTYNRIKPFFTNRYIIKFSNVSESGYFLTPYGTHVILTVYDTLNSKVYLLDPTFHRYGPLDEYHDYLFFSMAESIEGINKKETDVSFSVNHGEPMIIRNNFISVLTIEDINGKFDKDNFILSIQANHRHEYTGRYVFALRKQDGHMDILEDKWFENITLPPEDIDVLKKRLTAWFYSLGK